MVQQMVTGDWFVLLHTSLWTKCWFVVALASKSPFKKSCHRSKGGLLCTALLRHRSKHPRHLVPVGRRGFSRKQGLEHCRWVFLPRLFSDEGNAMHSKQGLSSAESCKTLLLCCFHILLRFLLVLFPMRSC